MLDDQIENILMAICAVFMFVVIVLYIYQCVWIVRNHAVCTRTEIELVPVLIPTGNNANPLTTVLSYQQVCTQYQKRKVK